MNVMTLEPFFVLGFYACFQNAAIIRVYVVASGLGMLFYRGADIPSPYRPVFSPPRFPTSFPLSNVCKWHVFQLTLYTIPFNSSFVGLS